MLCFVHKYLQDFIYRSDKVVATNGRKNKWFRVVGRSTGLSYTRILTLEREEGLVRMWEDEGMCWFLKKFIQNSDPSPCPSENWIKCLLCITDQFYLLIRLWNHPWEKSPEGPQWRVDKIVWGQGAVPTAPQPVQWNRYVHCWPLTQICIDIYLMFWGLSWAAPSNLHLSTISTASPSPSRLFVFEINYELFYLRTHSEPCWLESLLPWWKNALTVTETEFQDNSWYILHETFGRSVWQCDEGFKDEGYSLCRL